MSCWRYPIVLLALLLTPLMQAAEPEAPALSETQAAAVQALIAKLNADEMIAREDAERAILKYGLAALPLLKQATTSNQPEIMARAKKLVARLTELSTRPIHSFAETLPANSIFFVEISDCRGFLQKLESTPLGRFWQLPETKKFYKGHFEAQVPDDQKLLNAVGDVAKLLDGRALMALGPPETAEAAELDPPLVYVFETKQPQALETLARSVFEATGDGPKTSRRYGPYSIEEHITAQTVFGQDSLVHSLTQLGIESFLGNRLKRPDKVLQTLLAEIRAALPRHDYVIHLAAEGLSNLADAGQLIDDTQVEKLNAVGFVPGSFLQGVGALTADGAEELFWLKVGGAEKNQGLLAVLKDLAAKPAPAPAAGAPRALELIPWQTGVLISFNASFAGRSAAFCKAIRQLDAEQPPPPKPAAAEPKRPGLPATEEKLAPAGKAPGETIVGEGLEKDPPKADPKADPKETVLAAPTYPHLARFERFGLKLDTLVEQIDGPVQLALFPQQVDDQAPEELPLSWLFVAVLKDSATLEQALEIASGGEQAALRKETLHGGTHYVELGGDDKRLPGFWLKDKYFIHASDRELIEMAMLALSHQKGSERFSDRASYKQALADQRLDPNALLSVFGDADQVLEMPYKLSKVNWEEDPENPWPEYGVAKKLLENKMIVIVVGALTEGLQIKARTPLSLLGTVQAFRLPFKEAGY